MHVEETGLSGLLLIEPNCHRDERGFFLEAFQGRRYREAGVTDEFVQDNHSHSRQGVLRGLHFQVKQPQAQLVGTPRGASSTWRSTCGSDSATFGRWYGRGIERRQTAAALHGAGLRTRLLCAQRFRRYPL